jgi:hypothetical protein
MGIQGAHPVRINVILDRYQIGTDEGLVEFSDGLLKFHGTKTRFAISADAATESAFFSGSTFPKVNGLDHVVQIWPFERLDPNEDRVITHLYVRALEAWKKAATGPSAETVLPPKSPATVRDVRAMREPLSPFHDIALLLILAAYFSRAIEEQGLAILMPAALILLQALALLAAYGNRKRFLRKLSL